MKAWGHTMFMISCSTNSEAAEVLMLNPARFSSSAMVAVPPDDDAFVAAPLAVGATAMIDTESVAPAMTANADRFKYPLSRIVLPCSSVAPVTADSCFFRTAWCRNAHCQCRKMAINVTQLPHSHSSTTKEILQKPGERGRDPVRIARSHNIPARDGNLTRQIEPECKLSASCVICDTDH
jgi:hypothetical protein